jgi:hypothetical protein
MDSRLVTVAAISLLGAVAYVMFLEPNMSRLPNINKTVGRDLEIADAIRGSGNACVTLARTRILSAARGYNEVLATCDEHNRF